MSRMEQSKYIERFRPIAVCNRQIFRGRRGKGGSKGWPECENITMERKGPLRVTILKP